MYYTYKATLVRVKDGDTVVLDIDLGFDTHLIETVRLALIDTPEVKHPGAAEATARVAQLLTGHPLQLNVQSYDRYHRSVGLIHVIGKDGQPEAKSVSQILLDEQLAVPYK